MAAKPDPLGASTRLSGSSRFAGAEDDSRETKRQRTATTCTSSISTSDALVPSLTPDLWALIMSCLPFSEIVRCTAVSRVFRRDVVPLVKEVTAMFSRDMKQLKSARLFQGAEKVTIACLLKGEQCKSGLYVGYTGIGSSADATVVSLAVPFASSFSSMKEIRMGYFGLEIGGAFRAGGTLNSSRSLMQSLTLSFCGAYESGLIPSNTVVTSFFAWCVESRTENGCEYCARCVASFPPKELALSYPYRSRYLCMFAKNILAVIAKRDGGKEVLESKEFLLSLFENSVRCRAFVGIVEEFGLVPATVSSDEARQLISDGAMKKMKESHIEALRSLGVPI